MVQVYHESSSLAHFNNLGTRATEATHMKTEMKDSFKIERPIPKYADGRRTSAPAILWSAANLFDDKPTTSSVDSSINLLQRLMERQRVLTSHINNADTASPDSGVGLDQPLDSTESHSDAVTCGGFTTSSTLPTPSAPPNRHVLHSSAASHLSPFIWPWLNAGRRVDTNSLASSPLKIASADRPYSNNFNGRSLRLFTFRPSRTFSDGIHRN